MRVLVAPDAVAADSTMCAVDVAARLVEGWSIARPADEVRSHPLSAGGAGFLEVLAAAVGGEREVGVARDASGIEVPCTWLRAGPTAYVEAAPLLGDPYGGDAGRLAIGGTTAGVGDILLAATRAGARRVVIGVGESATHDVGLGALQAVAGARPDAPADEVLRAATDALAGVEILVAAATSAPLVGLSGAGAALANRPGIDAAAAQARELTIARTVATIESAVPERRSLLAGDSGKVVRPSRRPHAGAGGGLAFALGCTGARVLPGADVLAAETGLRTAVAGSDFVLTAVGVLDGGSLDGGVPGAVGRLALEALVPAVAIAPSVLLSRREISGTGLEAVYPLTDPSQPGRVTPSTDLGTALSQRASRVARTWSR